MNISETHWQNDLLKIKQTTVNVWSINKTIHAPVLLYTYNIKIKKMSENKSLFSTCQDKHYYVI